MIFFGWQTIVKIAFSSRPSPKLAKAGEPGDDMNRLSLSLSLSLSSLSLSLSLYFQMVLLGEAITMLEL